MKAHQSGMQVPHITVWVDACVINMLCPGVPPAPGLAGKDPIELLMQQLDGSPVPSERLPLGLVGVLMSTLSAASEKLVIRFVICGEPPTSVRWRAAAAIGDYCAVVAAAEAVPAAAQAKELARSEHGASSEHCSHHLFFGGGTLDGSTLLALIHLWPY